MIENNDSRHVRKNPSKSPSKTPRLWLSVLAAALLLVLLVLTVLSVRASREDASDTGQQETEDAEETYAEDTYAEKTYAVETYDWEELFIADLLPEPESAYGRVVHDYQIDLGLHVYRVTQDQYSRYVKACQERGFTIDAAQAGDAEAAESWFHAFNEQGYELSLTYSSETEVMKIRVREGVKLEDLSWPDSEMARMLPVPQSTVGKIAQDDETMFVAYVGDSGMDDFKSYVQACEAKGFDVDSYETGRKFFAKNEDHYELAVEYQGNDIFCVTLEYSEFKWNGDECIEETAP